MRVTQNTNFNTVRDTLNRSKGRMENYQLQASTLRKLNQPSDDPIGSAKILEVRTEKVNNEQFTENSRLAQAFLNNSDHVIGELADIIVRAKEIALNQSSGASSTDETRLGVAEEITQLYEQAITLANTRIGDRYIFGGYKTDRAPVDADGIYQGDDGEMMAEVARNVFISMNVPGIDVFNTQPVASRDYRQLQFVKSGAKGDFKKFEAEEATEGNIQESGLQTRRQNANVFDGLQNLRISLLTGDLEGIRSTLDNFDQIHAHLIANRAKVGSRVRGLDTSIGALERHNLTNAALVQNLEDADMAKVMSDLSKEEAVYKSVLSSSNRLVSPTLMDFLK